MLPVSPNMFEQTPTIVYMLVGSLAKVDANDSDVYDQVHLHCVKPDSYNTVPHTKQARKADNQTRLVQKWHTNLLRLPGMCDSKYESFLCYCTEFFIDANWLWRKDCKGKHKLVVAQDH